MAFSGPNFSEVNALAARAKAYAGRSGSPPGSALDAEQSSVNLGISSWEIDFFGRIRSLKNQALEEYMATDQARRSRTALLVSTVANAYLTLAADRQTLKLGVHAGNTAGRLRFDQRRYEVGLANRPGPAPSPNASGYSPRRHRAFHCNRRLKMKTP